jgi:hypothetical protein
LQDFNPIPRQRLYHRVHIIDFEEDVMNSAALLFKKVLKGVAIPFERLDKLQLKTPDLGKGYPYLDVPLLASVDEL